MPILLRRQWRQRATVLLTFITVFYWTCNNWNFFSLHITFRNNILTKFLCCCFLEILPNLYPGYKALLIATRHSRQRPVGNAHTPALRLQSLCRARLSPTWEYSRKSSFAIVLSHCPPNAPGASAGKSNWQSGRKTTSGLSCLEIPLLKAPKLQITGNQDCN